MTKLTILDQTPVFGTQSGVDAVRRSIACARYAEEIGYDAYWVTEQHSMKAFGCASPEILAANILAQTNKIRVGVAGILIGHYSPLKVAENIALLNAIGNGRFDFGIGRTPGAMPDVTKELGGETFTPEELDRKSDEIISYLSDMNSLSAVPVPDSFDSYCILCGSMGGAVKYAAQNGLPLAYAMFVNPTHCQEAIEYYRSNFVPSKLFDKPRVSLAVNAIVAESDDIAQELALPAINFLFEAELTVMKEVFLHWKKPNYMTSANLRIIC
ncbi:hypothetical protein CTT31_18290 [Pseudoalteromonas maricaloris]|uniref:MsnO8 family LLM class oxidoreductase n=1 Tax=Pseudoalteromonas maricaloris TaxID=184924 RepID=UPI0021ADAB78|nr:MsnO8 family LLM class oxidoreductase [Pseudoalteromonas flavipulchra]USE71057.1 hypothetical protein CTT31_18290 [Pseudoalteromonas flavipulchra]